jgi:hypothetical protein
MSLAISLQLGPNKDICMIGYVCMYDICDPQHKASILLTISNYLIILFLRYDLLLYVKSICINFPN